MVDAFLDKKYKFVKSENFDKLLDFLGISPDLRKAGEGAVPVTTLSKQGDEYVILTETGPTNYEVRFKPGVEFDHVTLDGRTTKNTITIDGATLHEVVKSADGKTIQIDRTWSSDELKAEIAFGNNTATRTYKLQA